MIKPFNGHRSYGSWNVFLWLSSDQDLYNICKTEIERAKLKRESAISDFVKRKSVSRLAAPEVIKRLPAKTPDGARYTTLSVRLALKLMFEDR